MRQNKDPDFFFYFLSWWTFFTTVHAGKEIMSKVAEWVNANRGNQEQEQQKLCHL